MKFGILGATEVARDILIKPAREMDKVTVHGVAARDEYRAKAFAEKYEIPHVFSDYDALLASEEIETVYIPLVSRLHAKWLVRAAEAGKHVLVEKPICLQVDDIKAIRNAVSQSRVEVLEGLMVQHHPLQKKLREFVESRRYGRLLAIETYLSIPFSEDYVSSFADKGGGVFIHNCGYWLQLVQSCLGLRANYFEGRAKTGRRDGVNIDFSARLGYDDDRYSTFYCSWKDPYKINHTLRFEHATIKIDNFMKPSFGRYRMFMDICSRATGLTERIAFEREYYYLNQLNFFLKVIAGVEKNMPLNEAFERVEVMEKIYNLNQECKRTVA